MRRKIIVLVAAVFFCFSAVDVFAQKITFTSGYTNLNKACKTLRGGDGQDDASLCKGLGGYQIRIYSSAAATHLVVEKPNTDISIPMGTVSLAFNQTKTNVEWRMANGRVFALIIRLPKYGETTDADPYIGKQVGEELVVVGLSGYEETISGEVDAKTPNANVKAREIADNAFTAALKK